MALKKLYKMTKDLANDEVGKTSAIQKSNIDAPNSLEGKRYFEKIEEK